MIDNYEFVLLQMQAYTLQFETLLLQCDSTAYRSFLFNVPSKIFPLNVPRQWRSEKFKRGKGHNFYIFSSVFLFSAEQI